MGIGFCDHGNDRDIFPNGSCPEKVLDRLWKEFRSGTVYTEPDDVDVVFRIFVERSIFTPFPDRFDSLRFQFPKCLLRFETNGIDQIEIDIFSFINCDLTGSSFDSESGCCFVFA